MMSRQTCTRRLEFDAAHRVMKHESKCKNLHGHRYAVELTVEAVEGLDSLGRVIDFGVVKQLVGDWIDNVLDHGTIVNRADTDLIDLCKENGWRLFVMEGNPTAENLARVICDRAAALLLNEPVRVTHVRLYETPNCWADYRAWHTGG